MEQEDSEEEDGGVAAKKDVGVPGKGWEIVILEVSFTIKNAFTLTFRAPQLKEITINMCKINFKYMSILTLFQPARYVTIVVHSLQH